MSEMVERETQKPPYGSPCNHCGLCCKAELCPLAANLYQRREGPCPALEMHDGLSHCGLSERPEKYFPIKAAVAGSNTLKSATAVLIGVGVGCDAQTDDEVVPETERRKMIGKYVRLPSGKINSAKHAWGVRID